MPDKRMLFSDNIGELSRHSRLTGEVPFISLHPHDCGNDAVTQAGTLVRSNGISKPAVSEQDAIQMMQRWAIGAAARALALVYEGRFLAVAVLAVVTAACATLSPSSPAEEKVKVVTERATARWNAIIGKDFATAYGYMSPASRATVTPNGFKTIASRIEYRAVKVT